MTKVTKITPSVIDSVRTALIPVFNKIEKELGIKLEAGNARYRDSEFKLRIEGIISTKGTAGMSKTEVDLKNNLERIGSFFSMIDGVELLPEDYGKTFEHGRKVYTFIGLDPKKRKYPIAAKNEEGQIYYFPEGTAILIRPVKPIVIKRSEPKAKVGGGVKMSDIINPMLIKGESAEKIADAVIAQFPEKAQERAKLIQQIKGPRTLNLIKAGKLRK